MGEGSNLHFVFLGDTHYGGVCTARIHVVFNTFGKHRLWRVKGEFKLDSEKLGSRIVKWMSHLGGERNEWMGRTREVGRVRLS